MNRILSTARRQCASSVFREALGSSKMRPGRAAYINRNGILRKVKPENRSISSNTAQVVEMPSNARNDSIFASRDGSGHNDALSCKSTLELIRALVVFRLCTIPVFVQHSRTMYDASRNLFGQRFVDAIVKNSFFAHFCGGESEEELAGMVKKLQEKGIGSILDYAAETEIETSNGILTSTESSAYDENTASMLKSISSVSRVKARSSDESFAALKVTALGDPVLLRDASTVIRSIINVFKKMDANETGFLTIEALNRAFTATGTILDNEKSNEIFRRIDTDNDGKIFLIDFVDSLFPTTEDSTSIGFFKDSFALPEFGPTQTKALRDVAKRLETIAKHAEDCGVTVMVDAEHTFMQPAIDQLTLQAMRRHNKARPTVFNTYQCYLRDSMPRVLDDLARARRGGFVFGAKIVRGAYMLQVPTPAALFKLRRRCPNA